MASKRERFPISVCGLLEQNAVRALATADRAYVLDLDTVAAQGAQSDLLNDKRVRSAYLGV